MGADPASPSGRAAWTGVAFGLELHAPRPIVGVREAAPGRLSRSVALSEHGPADLDRRWPAERSERLFTQTRQGDRRVTMTIDRHPELGFRLWVPGFGRYLVSPDGRAIDCAPPAARRWPWRLLFAQALPLCAALQGLEVLHSSAVGMEGGAWLFVGRSGSGKTTLACHLALAGHGFIADDVTALEARPDGPVVAHPGCEIAHQPLNDGELSSKGAGEVVASADKAHVRLEVAAEPAPVEVVCFLERGDFDGPPRLEDLPEPDPRLVLGSTFVFYVEAAERLVAQLDVASELVEQARVLRLRVPLTASPREALEALEPAVAR